MQKQRFSLYLARRLVRLASSHYLRFKASARDFLPPPKKDKSYLLYIHIPFCSSLCPYCSFNRFLFDESRAREYFINLRREIRLLKERGFSFNSIYAGGGTTTIMPSELVKTLELAKELFDIKEVSVEADPNQLKKEILCSFKGLVDRLSVGVQSFDDGILKQLNRYEKFGSSVATIDRLKEARGILPILNIDLIFNFAKQDEDMLRRDLNIIKELAPEQVTTYPLMTSPQNKNSIKSSLGASDESKEEILYNIICESLKDDYQMLSAWAFGKKDSQIFDEYVVDYDEYVGAGSGSFSFLDGVLYINSFSLKEYAKRINSGQMGVVRERGFSKMAQQRYRLMVDLFGGKISAEKFKSCFLELAILRACGDIYKEGGFYYPTAKGRYLALAMMKEFYIGMDAVRAQSRAMLNSDGE